MPMAEGRAAVATRLQKSPQLALKLLSFLLCGFVGEKQEHQGPFVLTLVGAPAFPARTGRHELLF